MVQLGRCCESSLVWCLLDPVGEAETRGRRMSSRSCVGGGITGRSGSHPGRPYFFLAPMRDTDAAPQA